MHQGTLDDVAAIFENFENIEVKSFSPANKQSEDYVVNYEKAMALWEEHKENFLNSDILFFSDTVPFCRPVLENMDKITNNQKIFIWITNAFDYGHSGDIDFYNLLKKYKDDSRITFLCANNYDRKYINEKVGTDFQNMHFFTFYGKRNKKDFNLKNQKNHEDKLFVMNYQNEKDFYPLYENLKQLEIDFYVRNYVPREDFAGPFDIETCSAILHIPYMPSTVAQKEYMSLGKTYILPTENWIAKNRVNYPSIWHRDGHKFLEYSEFYKEENRDLFIYFDDLSEIPAILKNKELLIEKGKKCFERTEIDRQNNVLFLKNIIFGKDSI
jgi:hypothetical protein